VVVTWSVKTIRLGTISADKSGLTHFRNFGVKLELPIWCVAATDGRHKVLIDTGIDDIDWVVAGPEPAAHQRQDEQMRAALKAAMDWSPGDVDIVINTHLHFDHCGCNFMFKNARIYVQKKEMEAAYDPPAGIKHLYAPKCFDKHAVPYFQWEFLDGEAAIAPGLLVFPTPGHTLGHQSVLINIEEGALCVAGDVASLVENITANIETSILVDAAAVYASFDSIRRKADFIIPGHEPGIPNLCKSGFPRID
jgi:glyoxylase-like metal-dependent hydrolase (beta-lactamase superfamily II)